MNSQCPLPLKEYPQITMAHGGGGKLSQRLIKEIFLPAFDNIYLSESHDGALLPSIKGPIAMTTDAHVVRPLFFPGGDIGSLAVNGTVNDLAMCGAKPKYLSISFILEEGLPTETLWKVVQSIKAAAQKAQVQIVTGDTKVVEKGQADGMYLSTTGIGEFQGQQKIAPQSVKSKDVIVLSGDIGRHGIAVLSQREGFQFDTGIESDCASLWEPVEALLENDIEVHCLRDLTRGGLAAAVTEICQTSSMSTELDESKIPVLDSVRGACEILGLDPIHIANEGRFIVYLPEQDEEKALKILKKFPISENAKKIGHVLEKETQSSSQVWIKGAFGQRRILLLPSGDQLPRIC